MMDTMCSYPGNRDEILIAYLYDDVDPAERRAFDAHVTTCAQCRIELAELRSVRSHLGRWAPPEPATGVTFASAPHAGRRPGVWATLGEIPAWAQVAAALLVLGVSAAIANLDVRYDHEGLTVRTGWSKVRVVQPPSEVAPPFRPPSIDTLERRGAPAGAAIATAGAPWTSDLAALEQRLRTELHSAAPQPARIASSSSDPELLHRVRALVDESERRQQRELALRLAEVVRDVNAQRQADLVKIDRNLGMIQRDTGVEAMKQREMINYIFRSTSQRR